MSILTHWTGAFSIIDRAGLVVCATTAGHAVDRFSCPVGRSGGTIDFTLTRWRFYALRKRMVRSCHDGRCGRLVQPIAHEGGDPMSGDTIAILIFWALVSSICDMLND